MKNWSKRVFFLTIKGTGKNQKLLQVIPDKKNCTCMFFPSRDSTFMSSLLRVRGDSSVPWRNVPWRNRTCATFNLSVALYKAILVHMQASKSLLTEGLQPSNICLDVYSSKKSLRRANYRIAPSCGGGRHHSTGSGLAEQTARCEPPHGVTVHVLQHLGRECCVNVQHVHPIL